MSRLNKNLQSKKGICTCSPCPKNKQRPKLGFYQIHTLHLSLLSSCASSAAEVVTKHTGGQWFCVMASESLSKPIKK